jgi:ribosomal protein S13
MALDEMVQCLVDGSWHFEISVKYLRSIGYTKARYLREFPNAKLKSKNAYEKDLSEEEIEHRREAMREKVADPTFQANRIAAIRAYWASIRSKNERKLRGKRTKWQHENTDIEDKLREAYGKKKNTKE